jgi:hypothetical protein
LREDGPCLKKYCSQIRKENNLFSYQYVDPRHDNPHYVTVIELKDYLMFQDEFHDIKSKFMIGLQTSLLGCLKISPEMNAFNMVFNISMWPDDFSRVGDFEVHAKSMCASWTQMDVNTHGLLPPWVRLMLENELRHLKHIMSTSEEINNLIRINDKKRRLFWPLFFATTEGKKLPALTFFWKLQQQLGRSGVAVEQFISRLHYMKGDVRRQHSSEEWLEWCLMACYNGPSVELFDPTEAFKVWRLFGHQMVKVGCMVPQPALKERLVYGDEKRAQRAMKKKEKRKRMKIERDQSRGFAVVELDNSYEEKDDLVTSCPDSSEDEVLLKFSIRTDCVRFSSHLFLGFDGSGRSRIPRGRIWPHSKLKESSGSDF